MDSKLLKFQSTSGLGTKQWGPSGWFFLFSCIMGGYPFKIDPKNKEHVQIRKHFKNMFTSLMYTMPCIFCRNSFKQFLKDYPIKESLVGRIELMNWLYVIRDKVNKKLISQERECYNNEKKRLKIKYYKGSISKTEYYEKIDKIKSDIYTKESPPFIEILEMYEKYRAVCSPKAKTCSI